MIEHALNPAFQSSYERLARACARVGASLETPSHDGYVRLLTYREKRIMFTADALPLNTAAAHVLARDKIATSQILEQAGLPTPRSLPFFGERHLDIVTRAPEATVIEHLADRVREIFPALPPLIVKPGRSSGGNGVVRCTTIDEVITAARQALTYSHSGIVQEFIDGRDYRAVFLDDTVLIATREENNQPLRIEPIDELARLTHHAQQLLGLHYGSMDCRQRNDGSFIILELNGNPGFDRLERYYPDDVARIMDAIVHRILDGASMPMRF